MIIQIPVLSNVAFLNKDFISKYFLFVLALSVIHSCWLELDYLVNPTQSLTVFFRAQFVSACQSCSRLRLQRLLRFSRALQTSHKAWTNSLIEPIALALAFLAIEISASRLTDHISIWTKTPQFSANSSPITFSSQNSTRCKGHRIQFIMNL